jgi:VIT1/CCC1 family predicted Fe2+/Mn2+ transporter
MPLPAFLIPALTGFAISKLTGASTKKALQSALLGAAVGGITQGFGADKAATGIKEMGDASSS